MNQVGYMNKNGRIVAASVEQWIAAIVSSMDETTRNIVCAKVDDTNQQKALLMGQKAKSNGRLFDAGGRVIKSG